MQLTNSPQVSAEDLRDLPSLPVVIQKLHSLLDDRHAGIPEIASVVESDQAFAARVLRLVNSPFYGFGRRVASMEEAITILGFNALHQLLLTTSVVSSFDIPSHVLDVKGFWRHSFGVGVVAKQLLYKTDKDTQNEAFMCGILHDIGRLVYVKRDPRLFVWFYFERAMVSGLEEEKEHFGINHQDVGETVAKLWNFPESISTVIATHHTPESCPKDYYHLVSAVNIADILCHAMRIGHSGQFYISDFFPETWSALKLDMATLRVVLEKALDAIDKSEALLGEFS
jgi:HD-like signal output (HDOD) protein